MPNLPDKLQKERSVLLLIDMQEKFRSLIYQMPEVVTCCARMIRFCERLGIPILVTEHYSRGLGPTLMELRNLITAFKPLEKITFSCDGDDGFRSALAKLDRDQIIICGIETHVCVYQTAYDLLADGRQVAVAVDAASSRSPHDRQIGLARMSQLGAQNMGVEMIMFEILRRAKTDEFKDVADILKE